MSKQRYEFAVIGLGGGRGWTHCVMMEELGKPRLHCKAVAEVFSPNEHLRGKFGERAGIATIVNCWRGEKVDYVGGGEPGRRSTSSMPWPHCGGAFRFYLEKAVSNKWQNAVRLYREAVQNSYPLFVGYNLRRFPAAVAVKRLLDRGAIGKVQSVLAHVNTGSELVESHLPSLVLQRCKPQRGYRAIPS